MSNLKLQAGQTAVITGAGSGFGADEYVRLSFSTSQERIHEGLRRIADWVKKI